MNMNISSNNGLENNILIKADDKSAYETNKNPTKNKIMNESERNFKSSKKKNQNFLRKQIIKESNNYTNDQKDKECIPSDFFKNNIFKYYYSTIEYLKKNFNCYINNDYNNSISINKRVFNINNYYICDKNTRNLSDTKTSNINKNNNMKNNFFINNYQVNKINFIYNNFKNENDKNKASGPFNNLEKEDTNKMNSFSKEVITNININSNNDKCQNFIININCPSFKPSNYKNTENNNVKSEESDKISNRVENKNKGNDFQEEEFSTQMFGKKGWICVLCNNFNFEARIKCNRCKALKNPKKIVKTNSKIKQENNPNNRDENSDWICSKCQNLNYSFRTICNRCKAPKIYQFEVKPFLYQNIICNNIIRCLPELMPPYVLLNNMPNIYKNKIV